MNAYSKDVIRDLVSGQLPWHQTKRIMSAYKDDDRFFKVIEVLQDLQTLFDNGMAFRALDMGHESHATRVALVGGVIQALSCRRNGISHVGTSCELVAPTASSRVQRRKVRLEAGPVRVSKRSGKYYRDHARRINQLRGWTAWYEPDAVADHERGGAGPRRTARVEALASPTGEYVLRCCRIGDRPVPAAGLRFESRPAARVAARVTEQYRAALRQYDPSLPRHDVVVCQENQPPESDPNPPGIGAIRESR